MTHAHAPSGWKMIGATTRSFRHKSGATAFTNALGMWVATKPDGERQVFTNRDSGMLWAATGTAPTKRPAKGPKGWPSPDEKILETVRRIGPATMGAIVEVLGCSPAGAHAPLMRLLGQKRVKRRELDDSARGRRIYVWEVAA